MEEISECLFRFRCPEAEAVSLIRTFNDWLTTATPMTRRPDGVWEVQMSLRGGNYSYCYFIIETYKELGRHGLLTSLANHGSKLVVPGTVPVEQYSMN